MYEGDSFDLRFISREELLSKVTQIEIMEYYLGVKVEFNKTIRNPLRNDKNPGCRFYVKNGRVRFVDYSKGFNEDCFGVVQYIHACNFDMAIRTIVKDFNLYDKITVNVKSKNHGKDKEIVSKIEESKPKEYLYELSTDKNDNILWRYTDKEYWRNHCLNSKILKGLDIYPLNTFYIDGQLIYAYKHSDPAYIYLFPDNTFKVYFPYRAKGKRFITNSQYIQGLNHLPEEGDFLVITKSMKDIACLKLFEIPSIAPQSEVSYIKDEILDELDERFGQIVTLFDFDLAGVRAANKLRKKRYYEPLFFTTGKFNTKGYRAKDFSHYLRVNKRDNTLKLIQETYNQIIL